MRSQHADQAPAESRPANRSVVKTVESSRGNAVAQEPGPCHEGPFHEGEIAAQQRVLGRDLSVAGRRMIHDHIPPAAEEFLAQQPMLVLGGQDTSGAVWATVLSGQPGFAHAASSRQLVVHSPRDAHDPLLAELEPDQFLGTLAIEPSTRRRMRLNGRVADLDAAGFSLSTDEVFSNCPKYIQARELRPLAPRPDGHRSSDRLDAAQQQLIREADTLFIASLHAGRGADVSHRGGRPGFARVDDEKTLLIPDYSGNNLFQTLGNLSREPRSGLLFVDFPSGDLLHLSGRATIDWQPNAEQALDGAPRLVRFQVEAVVHRMAALGLDVGATESSPYNPPLSESSAS